MTWKLYTSLLLTFFWQELGHMAYLASREDGKWFFDGWPHAQVTCMTGKPEGMKGWGLSGILLRLWYKGGVFGQLDFSRRILQGKMTSSSIITAQISSNTITAQNELRHFLANLEAFGKITEAKWKHSSEINRLASAKWSVSYYALIG